MDPQEQATKHNPTPWERLQSNPTSLRLAINAKCYDCIYDPSPGHGNWRRQVSDCTAIRCPLWMVRPMSLARKSVHDPDDDETDLESTEETSPSTSG